MSNGSFPRRTIEKAIDRAVRDMIQIDPRPGLRRRVLSRLKTSAGPQALGSFGPWGGRPWVLSAAAAVLVIAFALLFVRSDEKPREVAQTPAPSGPSTRSTPSIPSPASIPPTRSDGVTARSRILPADQRQGRTESRSEAIFGPQRDRVTAATIDRASTPADHVSPLPLDDVPSALPPVTITPLLPISEIRVAPIEIQRITIPPLFPGREP